MMEFILGASLTINLFLLWKLWEREALLESLLEDTSGSEEPQNNDE